MKSWIRPCLPIPPGWAGGVPPLPSCTLPGEAGEPPLLVSALYIPFLRHCYGNGHPIHLKWPHYRSCCTQIDFVYSLPVALVSSPQQSSPNLYRLFVSSIPPFKYSSCACSIAIYPDLPHPSRAVPGSTVVATKPYRARKNCAM